MKKRNGISQGVLLLLSVAMAPMAFAFGQAQSQSSQSSQQSSTPAQAQPPQKDDSAADAAKKAQKDKPKPKKVYTEEDLSSMHGSGVSVVGDDSSSGGSGTKPADGKAKPGVVPMSGQDEAYWRGKARAILDEIAAREQQIAKLKDDIKKYGAGGFDVTTGMKDNVAYIEDRNGQLKELEKRKAGLEKKLDQLQEDGRKAGADASWFR